MRSGETIRQSLLADEAKDGLTFTLNRTRWLSGDQTNTTPRHHHAFQQVRWAESGSVNYGPDQDIPEGDIAYFPKGAWYGPQKRDQGISTTIQFGFDAEKQHGTSFWRKYQSAALERLKERGSFIGGVFVEVDADTGERREIDGVQALYEEQYKAATGKPFVVPSPGYNDAILMHPHRFDYFQVAPGVEMKRLGEFFDQPGPDGSIRFSMVRLSEGGVFEFSGERAQVAWSISPGLTINGRDLPEKTYVYSPREETLAATGRDGVELFVIDMPRRS